MQTEERERFNILRTPKLRLLLTLGGLGLFVLLVFWLKQIWNSNSFSAVLVLPNANGIEVGMPLTYRGVEVGKVIQLNPEPQAVNVVVEITPVDRIIPSQSSIRPITINGRTVLDITPTTALNLNQVRAKPTDAKCNPNLIICSNEKAFNKKSIFFNPFASLRRIEFNVEDVTQSVENVNSGVENIEERLVKTNASVKSIDEGVQEIRTVAKSAEINRTLIALQQAARDVSILSRKAGNLSDNANRLLVEANQSNTINRVNNTLTSVTNLADRIQSFLAINQKNLTTTLTNISEVSKELSSGLRQLQRISMKVEQSKFFENLENSKLLENLETISVNAAELSENLRSASVQLNDPQTILKIQQILDSARTLFENLNKVTSDVDELTGNPKFRRDLLRIIQGLSGLLSSTQLLQEQVEYDHKLTQINAKLELNQR